MSESLKIILASRSRARVQMLQEAGYDFDIIPADINEKKIIEAEMKRGTKFEKIALKLAEEKALAVRNEENKDSYIIGSDQLLIFEDKILSKSETLDEAREKLLMMQGKEHQLISAVCVKAPLMTFISEDSAMMTMKHLSAAQIDDYLKIATDDALQCVGGYAIERKEGRALFDDVRGDDYTIMGMPLPKLVAFFDRQNLPRPVECPL